MRALQLEASLLRVPVLLPVQAQAMPLGVLLVRAPVSLARPVQASLTSAASFAVGALIPLVAILIATTDLRIALTAVVSVLALGSLGFVGARLGGAPPRRATLRVVVGGVGAMALTTLIGRLLGTAGG